MFFEITCFKGLKFEQSVNNALSGDLMVNGNWMSAKSWERVGLIVGGPIAQN